MFLSFIDDVLNFFKGLWEKVVAFHDGLDQTMKYVLYAACALVVVLIIVLIACGTKKRKKKKLAKKAAKKALEASENVEAPVEKQEEKPAEVVEEEKPAEAVEEEKPDEVAQEEKPAEVAQEEKPAEENEDEKRKVYGKYEVYQDSDFFKFTLKASNGEVLVDSEVYASLDGAYKAIESLKKNVTEGHLLITKDKNNAFQFKLIAKNHRVSLWKCQGLDVISLEKPQRKAKSASVTRREE